MTALSVSIKRLLFSLLLLLFIMPALQAKFHWTDEKALYGAYNRAPHPDFSPEELLSGAYQPALEHYLEDNLGYRTWLIRLRNQLSLSLLGVARSTDLVVGKDLVLFQPGPVAAYQGKDFLGAEEIAYRVQRLKAVQTALAQRGIPFLFVMAPNKARYQPETLPASFRMADGGQSNYPVFMREMKAQQVNLLDATELFRRWKDTTSYPLFPKGGTHWSGYGAELIADTLFARIEQLTKVDLPDFRRHGPITVSADTVRVTDGDLSDPMNLVFPYRHYPTAYATVTFDSVKAGQQRPNMLIIGDSFTWPFMQFEPYLQTLFAPESRFWGVDGTMFAYDKNYKLDGRELGQVDLRREIESRAIVLILITEHNLVNHSLIDRLYDLYYPLTEAGKARIEQIQKQLEQDPAIRERLWKQQYEDNHSLSDSLREQARARYDRELLRQ
jgi:hypothetical protein